jgi:hypothetical protein
MTFIDDLRKFAAARFKQHRDRQVLMYLNSLPPELKKDIGWTGEYRRPE